MLPLDRLEKLYLKGRITEWAYWEQKAAIADKVITLMETELAEAYELYDQAKGKDPEQALANIIKATTISHILDEIK